VPAPDPDTDRRLVIPGLDPAAVSPELRRDPAWLRRLLKGLTEEFARAAEATRRELAQGDRESAARRMHTLRGNAGTLGALDLMATAAGLETAIKDGVTDLGTGLKTLERQLAALAGGLSPGDTFTHPDGAPAATPSAARAFLEESDRARLGALHEALEAQDLAALRQFEDLRPALAAAWGEARTAALGRTILGLRFTEALAELESATGQGAVDMLS
jgi:HPt (histidine-containing phosphotransfer) domain-containing protein